jgi:hypothetical protein
MFGAATDPTNLVAIPITYIDGSGVGSIVGMNMDATNVNITTNSNWSAYTITYVIIEYLKQ